MPLSASFVSGNQAPANISGGNSVTYYGTGDDRVKAHVFTSDGTITFNEPGEIKHILLVGGGGSGGDSNLTVSNPAGLQGGGGGGGEVRIIDDVFTWQLTGGNDQITTASITVGLGGTSPINTPALNANDGGASSIGPYTAAGGGGGDGSNGGSGGGGAGWNLVGLTAGGSATASGYKSFGSDGGDSSNNGHGAGGGGATQAGQDGSAGGDGGDGYYWSVTGQTYGGGGGGGDSQSYPNGSGGTGGAGGGGDARTQDGSNGLGGGGGAGKRGGNGVVVLFVKYPVPAVLEYAISGSPGSVEEGNSFVMSVTTGNVNNGTTLYWTTNNITTADNDFVATSGNITIQNDAATFNVATVSGNVTGTETFNVSLRTSNIAGPIVATSNTLSITQSVVGGYPSWNTMPTYAEWTDEANNMSYSGTVTLDMVSGIGSSGSSQQQYALSIPGGNVILVGRAGPSLEWDPTTSTFTDLGVNFGITGASGTYVGGVLSTNGNVYIPPFDSQQNIIEYDPTTGTGSVISSSTLSTGGYYGSCPLDDGRIIFKPKNGSNHVVFDPSTNTVSTTNIANGSGFRHPAMVQHPKDGMVYMPPYRETIFRKWDPTTDTYSSITVAAGSDSLPSSDAYQDAVIGADSKIYATPWNSGDIGIFDIDTLFWQRYDPNNVIAPSTGGDRMGKGRLADDGRIYMLPNTQDDLIVIPTAPNGRDSDYGFSGNTCTSNVFVTNINSTIGSSVYWDGGVDGTGNIICAALTHSGSTLRINPNSGNAIVHDFHCSPYVNQG